MTFEIRQGGALALLRAIPDETVQCVVTSPPYWGLRDYGTATWDGGDPECKHAGRPNPRQDTHGKRDENHGRFAETRGTQPAKAIHSIPVRAVCPCGAVQIDEQIGLEPTPEEFVARIVEVFREVRRVLRKDGTLWMNLGDCYATGAGRRGRPPGRRRAGRQVERRCRWRPPWLTRRVPEAASLRRVGRPPRPAEPDADTGPQAEGPRRDAMAGR